ncbi:MAG: hypothetical protein FWD31_12675, partial [Planctomycetaceae bacterium]|nr:hypothetical protein [Planctomycetaceae bacterium]
MQRRVKFFFPGLALVGMCLATVTYAQEVRPQGNPDSRYSLGATAPQTVPQTAPQTSPQAAPQTAPQAASPTILHRETGSPSDIIYVRDEYGRLRPIVRGLSWSEFDALLKRLLQQNPEPLHSIHSLDAEGQVTDNMADLTIQLRIQTKNEPIVRIPLGLKSGIFLFETDLSQVAQYDGPSQFAIVANPQGNGYDMILQASDFRLRTADFDGRDEVANADRATPSSKSEGSSETPSSKSDDSSETPSPKSEGSPETPSPKSDDSSETPSSKSEGSSETPSSKSEVLFPEVPSRTQAVFPVSPEDEPQPQRFLWHTVTLRMAFPITQPSIGEYQWKAEFPAALSSRVQLAVPQQNAVVLQTKDGNLRQTILSDERRTTFVFQGTSNDFEVRWHEKQHVPLQERVVLQAENGRIVAKVTPAGVMFDATIPVQSSGGVLDSFQIRLPLGAVYRPNPASVATEYQIEEEFREQPETSEQPSKASPATVLVRLSQPTEGPVVVRVQAETPIHPSRNDWFEVGGFEVVGAVKQIGKLSVVVPPETRLSQHQESRGVRPGIDATVNETEGIVSSFEYYEQPCSLLVQAVPQAARVRLGQEYQVQIHRNRAVLHAKLSYTIHGSQKQVTIHMNGWQLTNIGPDNMVNRNEPPFMESGPVTISLHEPVGKTVELNLQAERVYDSNDGLIRFPFPIPDADSMEPAFVAILSEDNIELTVDESQPLVA